MSSTWEILLCCASSKGPNLRLSLKSSRQLILAGRVFSLGFLLLCRFQGTGRGCVTASEGSNGAVCQAPKLGLCCDTSQTNQNCLTAMGKRCDTYTPFGPGPVKAFCCDAMDLPGCEAFGDPTQCPVSRAAICVTKDFGISMQAYLHKHLSCKSSMSKLCICKEIQHDLIQTLPVGCMC